MRASSGSWTTVTTSTLTSRSTLLGRLAVLRRDLAGRAVGDDLPLLDPDRAVAHPLDRPHRVAHEEARARVPADLLDLLRAALAELGVTRRERLVDHEDVRHRGGGDREPQPCGHARAVRLHRQVDEVPAAGELDDVVEPLPHLTSEERRV